MNTTNILNTLQDKVIKKFNKLKVEISEEELEEMFGPGFINQYGRDADGTDDDFAAVDSPYITYRPIPVPKGKKAGSNYVPFGEAKSEAELDAEKDEQKVDTTAAEEDKVAGEEDVGAADVSNLDAANAGAGDFTGGTDNMGVDSALGAGMQEEEEPKTTTEIGRIYELKKIYSRLTSIEAYLGNESDQDLLQIRNYISKSIELFEVISSNFESYKDNLDEIIVMYYKFLLEVYNNVKDIYSKQAKSGDK